jgi:hypothetical protein
MVHGKQKAKGGSGGHYSTSEGVLLLHGDPYRSTY